LITSNRHFGGWSRNVLAWKQRTAPTVIVRYEDLVANPEAVLRDALSTVGHWHLPSDSGTTVPSFQDLHQAVPWFFRKGKVGAWRDEMPSNLHDLFWERHREAMVALDYPRELSGAKTIARTGNSLSAVASGVSLTQNNEPEDQPAGRHRRTDTVRAALPA
jgi:hypothetical protein